MNDIYKDKLIILRQRIPIGLRYGLTLLEKANGDLEKAEKQFKDEMVALAINKTGITSDIAIRHLVKNNFDISVAIKSINDELKSIDDEHYTYTELILSKHKGKEEDVLDKIMFAVEEQYNLKREFWLDFDCLIALPSEVYGFMVITEWLNYESWEDFASALSFNLNSVSEELKKLTFTNLANSLQQAHHIKTFVYTKHETNKDVHHYINARNELHEHTEFQKCVADFEKQRPVVIKRLYEFVKDNIARYP